MKRPFAVTTLQSVVLCITVWSSIRLYAALSNWDSLAEFAPRPGPLYISISAAFWILNGFALARLFSHPNARASRFAAMYVYGYTAWVWIDRPLFQQPRSNWPFALILTFIFLAFFSLLLLNRNLRNYYHQRETHDQQNTDSNPA